MTNRKHVREITTKPTEVYDPINGYVECPEDLVHLMLDLQSEHVSKAVMTTLGADLLAMGTFLLGFNTFPVDMGRHRLWNPITSFGAPRYVVTRYEPSGDPSPSEKDRGSIELFKAAEPTLDSTMHDYVIVGAETYWSYSNGVEKPIPEDRGLWCHKNWMKDK